ncbi:hypothetical protein ACFL3B_00770 [Gemmatimonadota bacterium]
MSTAQVQDLRRIAEALGQLQGHTVETVEIRSDCRLFRIAFSDGRLLLVSALVDETGKPRLDVDFLRTPEEASHGQLEVPFNMAEPDEVIED